jgi:hypothetical protein
MKRDMDLIREILHRAEELGPESVPRPIYDARSPEEAYQIALMKDAGLVEADMEHTNGIPTGAVITRLTWAGHDFLDASRDSTVWNKAVEHVIKPGASWTFSILSEWLKQEGMRRLGLLVGG